MRHSDLLLHSLRSMAVLSGARLSGEAAKKFSGTFFLAEFFEKVSFDPYNFQITRLSARKSVPMKTF